MLKLTQYYIRSFRPIYLAFLTRLLYWGRNVKIGRGLRVDTIPRILIDKDSILEIGENVELRRNVEIRVHGKSKIRIGNNVRIDRGVRLLSANNAVIALNDGCRIGLYSVFNGGDSITIGKKTLVSGYVYLQTSMHNYGDVRKNVQDQGYSHKPIILEEDTWLGTHVVVLPGVTIETGSVVGSSSVVTKSVSKNQIVAGVPAKKIKDR